LREQFVAGPSNDVRKNIERLAIDFPSYAHPNPRTARLETICAQFDALLPTIDTDRFLSAARGPELTIFADLA
jgi:hypothetical protein